MHTCASQIHAREILWLVINTERTYQDQILEKTSFLCKCQMYLFSSPSVT